MSYENHNCTPIATSLNIETIKSLHTFNDVFFVKKVKSNLVNCEEFVSIFEARRIPYELRAAREIRENSPRNFFRFSSVPRLKKERNKIVPNLNINNSLSLPSFKKTAKDVIFKYM